MSSRRVVIKFPRYLVDQPIICNLTKQYRLDFNILRASVTPREEGLLVLELSGKRDSLEKGLHYLVASGVEVQPLSQDIAHNEQRCTHCGACTGVCPKGALFIDRETFLVHFDSDKCIACEFCIKACPTKAMEVQF